MKIQGQGLIPHRPKSDDVAVMPSSSTSQLEAEIQEELNSMKRRLAQQQQEMEAKQREKQIVFLRSHATPNP
jgi:hypothetical protein